MTSTKIHIKRTVIAENNLTRTRYELDLCILKTHIFRIWIENVHAWRDNEWQPNIKSKGNSSAENYSTGTKFEIDLRILTTHLYTELQFKISNCDGDNERKLELLVISLVQGAKLCRKLSDRNKIRTWLAYYHYTSDYEISIQTVHWWAETNTFWNFSKFKGHISAENYSTRHNVKHNLRILVTNLCTKFHLKISIYHKEMSRNWIRKDGMIEGRKGVTLYAPAISWRGHKKVSSMIICICLRNKNERRCIIA